MDPLSALRDLTIRGELDKIVQINNEFHFDTDYTFPCAIETGYRSKRGNHYTLQTLVFFIKNQHLPSITYMQTSLTHKIPVVYLPDRKPLLDYLTGEISSSDSIDFLPKSVGFDGNEEFSDISLRLLDVSDVDDFMVWANNDKVGRFCKWEPYINKEDAINIIKNTVIPHPWFWAICLKNRPIGAISVTANSGNDVCRGELGYVFAIKYWGNGIASRAVKTVANTIFSEWPHLERLEALVDVGNIVSQRVLEKVGFRREGVLRKYSIQKGRSRDMVMFSLLSTDPKPKI